jgi:WD40 repeat protein
MKRLFLLVVCLLFAPSVHAQSFDKAKLAWNLPWDADWVTAVTFIGNDRVAAGNNLGDILVWQLPAALSEKAPPPALHLTGHTNSVNRLLTTPDQKHILSASNDHSIRIWDMNAEGGDMGVVVLNARAIDEALLRKKKAPAAIEVKVRVQKDKKTLAGHKDWVLGLSLTKDGNTLFSGDDKGEVIVWDRAAEKELRRWKVNGWVWALGVHPEGTSVLISERVPLIFDSGRHSGLKLCDADKGEVKADLAKEFKGQLMSAAAFSPDGKWLAVGRGGEADGPNGKITLLEPATGKKIRELSPGHLYGVTDLAFHPDGKHLFSAGRDTVVKIWNLEDGKHVRDLGTPRGGQFKDWIHAVALSPDGRWAAAADMMGQVQVWCLAP